MVEWIKNAISISIGWNDFGATRTFPWTRCFWACIGFIHYTIPISICRERATLIFNETKLIRTTILPIQNIVTITIGFGCWRTALINNASNLVRAQIAFINDAIFILIRLFYDFNPDCIHSTTAFIRNCLSSQCVYT